MPDPRLPAGAVRSPWPKLSEQLEGPRAPDRCQRCARLVSDDAPDGRSARQRWIEHDEHDRPTSVVVVLCQPCARFIIQPHPRLYARVPTHKPIPGVMSLCVGCRHQDALRCRHPDALANGGSGVAISVAPPTRAFLDGVRHGRRTGWVEEIWPSAPSVCAGREEKEASDA